MKQERKRNIQIGHRRALLSSPTYQITAIQDNYLWKNVSNELYCKTADSPRKTHISAHAFLPVMRMETPINSTHSIRALDHEDQIKFASGFTVTTFAQYTLVAFDIRK